VVGLRDALPGGCQVLGSSSVATDSFVVLVDEHALLVISRTV
jgi:hypothetical protein